MVHQDVNEILLLFNQPRIAKPFFDFFFLNRDPTVGHVAEAISFHKFPRAVTKFRGFALLCFGNFRYAFRQLGGEEELRYLQTRRSHLSLEIKGIPKWKTWELGYLASSNLVEDDARYRVLDARKRKLTLSELLEEQAKSTDLLPGVLKRVKVQWSTFGGTPNAFDMHKLRDASEMFAKEIRRNRAQGKQNTVRYLLANSSMFT